MDGVGCCFLGLQKKHGDFLENLAASLSFFLKNDKFI